MDHSARRLAFALVDATVGEERAGHVEDLGTQPGTATMGTANSRCGCGGPFPRPHSTMSARDIRNEIRALRREQQELRVAVRSVLKVLGSLKSDFQEVRVELRAVRADARTLAAEVRRMRADMRQPEIPPVSELLQTRRVNRNK